MILNGETVDEIVISRQDGYLFNILDFTAEDMPIREIAHNLAHINRYGGAQPYPVSVALHSLLVSYLVPAQHAYEALMHDATEAFVGDMMHPIKRHCPSFIAIEHEVRRNLVREYRLPICEHWAVIRADRRARDLECHYRRGAVEKLSYTEQRVCDMFLLDRFPPSAVVEMFLARFESSATLSLQ